MTRLAPVTSRRGPVDPSPVREMLASVNGRAASFTLTTLTAVRAVCERVESDLAARGVSPSALVGTRFTYRPAGPRANSYKYGAATTSIACRRVADGWRLESAVRDTVHPKQAESLRIEASDAALAAIRRHAFADIINARESV